MSGNRFVGAWRLLSIEIRSSGGEVSYPFGRDAVGLLIYSDDGHMAVSLMRADRVAFAESDMSSAGAKDPFPTGHGTDSLMSSAGVEEKLAAFDSYNSYSGRYEVKDDRIIHHVELSLFPNWVGGPQERHFEFSGDRLILKTPETTPDGVERTWVATWKRVGNRR